MGCDRTAHHQGDGAPIRAHISCCMCTSLGSWRLAALLAPLQDLGAVRPVDLLDLEDDDVASLGMKKLELKRWQTAIADLAEAAAQAGPSPSPLKAVGLPFSGDNAVHRPSGGGSVEASPQASPIRNGGGRLTDAGAPAPRHHESMSTRAQKICPGGLSSCPCFSSCLARARTPVFYRRRRWVQRAERPAVPHRVDHLRRARPHRV